MNDRANFKPEADFVFITEYMNAQSMFFDLGGHLGRCNHEEISALDQHGTYASHVANGIAAYTATMPTCEIMRIAKKLHGFETLWQGFVEGFTRGLEKRETSRLGEGELAKLVIEIRKYPELEQALQTHLTAHGVTSTVRDLSLKGEDQKIPAVALSRNGNPAEIYIPNGSYIIRAAQDKLYSHGEVELVRRAHAAFADISTRPASETPRRFDPPSASV